MKCIQCGINNPESNKICFHCRAPLINYSDLDIDTDLDEKHARFRSIKNFFLQLHLNKDSYYQTLRFLNDQYQFLKRPWLAAWLSILPGLGQLYNKQYLKALPFLISAVVLISLFFLHIKEDISNWFFIIYCGFIIISFMDAFTVAIIGNKKGTVNKRQYASLFFYGLFVLGSTILLLHWSSYGIVQFTKLNNSSLQPYLVKGDSIAVKKYVYWFTPPKRGDIVLYVGHGFTARDGEDLYLIGAGFNIERIIGLPGETVEFNNGKILINGTPLPENTYPLVTTSMPSHLQVQLTTDDYFILRSAIPQPGDTVGDKFFNLLGTPTSHHATIPNDENWLKASLVHKNKIYGKLWFIFNPPPHRRFF